MASTGAADATFVAVIRFVLAKAGGGAAAEPASAYELLMADADGDIDDDILPPRDKPVVDFGNDFALRRASAKVAAAWA